MPIANGQRRRGAQQAVRSNRPRTHCAGRRQTAGGAVNGAAGGVVDDVIGSVGSVGSVGAQRRCAPTNPTTDRRGGQIRRRQYNMRIASNPAGPR